MRFEVFNLDWKENKTVFDLILKNECDFSDLNDPYGSFGLI